MHNARLCHVAHALMQCPGSAQGLWCAYACLAHAPSQAVHCSSDGQSLSILPSLWWSIGFARFPSDPHAPKLRSLVFAGWHFAASCVKLRASSRTPFLHGKRQHVRLPALTCRRWSSAAPLAVSCAAACACTAATAADAAMRNARTLRSRCISPLLTGSGQPAHSGQVSSQLYRHLWTKVKALPGACGGECGHQAHHACAWSNINRCTSSHPQAYIFTDTVVGGLGALTSLPTDTYCC